MGRPVLSDKLCSGCKVRKPKHAFYGKARKSGHCKECQDRAQIERRIFVAEYLKAHPCVDCGEDDPIVLDFDHLDGAKKTDTISRMVRNNVTNDRLLEEIAKCVVRCANCHRRRTAQQNFWIYKTA